METPTHGRCGQDFSTFFLKSRSLDDEAQAAGLKTQLVKWLQLGLVRLDESLEEAGEVDAGAVGLDADEEPPAGAFKVDAARRRARGVRG